MWSITSGITVICVYIYRTYIKQDVTVRAEGEEININKTQRRMMNNRKEFDDKERDVHTKSLILMIQNMH